MFVLTKQAHNAHCTEFCPLQRKETGQRRVPGEGRWYQQLSGCLWPQETASSDKHCDALSTEQYTVKESERWALKWALGRPLWGLGSGGWVSKPGLKWTCPGTPSPLRRAVPYLAHSRVARTRFLVLSPGLLGHPSVALLGHCPLSPTPASG